MEIPMAAARLTAWIASFRLRLPLALWIATHRQRTDLGQLSDHLLSDIGLDRERARREASRRFWDL
jgi:uncharacterized protein YjiS (DUF1127 family)